MAAGDDRVEDAGEVGMVVTMGAEAAGEGFPLAEVELPPAEGIPRGVAP